MMLARLRMGFALGSVALLGTGCGLARSVVEGLADEGPPGVGVPALAGGERPVAESPGRAVAASGGEPAGTSSVYLASPALTWGARQLERPHSLMGSLFRDGPGSSGCNRAGVWSLEFREDGSAMVARSLARQGPTAVTGTATPVELSFRLDRDVMADRVTRSSAFLVQYGPMCADAFFEPGPWVGRGSAVLTTW